MCNVTAYYPSGNTTWTEDRRNGFTSIRAWKKWIPNGSKTVTTIVGKQEHYLSGSVRYSTNKTSTETINGDKVLKGTTWDVSGNTRIEGSLSIRSDAKVTIDGSLWAEKIVIEKGGELFIKNGGKVTASEVSANGGWINDNGGKIRSEQGMLITDNLTLKGRSSISLEYKDGNGRGKIIVRDTMQMDTNARSSKFTNGMLFIGKKLILNGNKKNFVSNTEDFYTVFYGKGEHDLDAKGSDYNLGVVCFENKEDFRNMDIGGNNFVKAVTGTVNETQWTFSEKEVLSASSSQETWNKNIESAFSGIAAQNVFHSNHSQLTSTENNFVDALAAIWINTLNTPLCEGFIEAGDVNEELHFKLGGKNCTLKCKGIRFSFGATGSVTLNVNNSENDTVIGVVSNADVQEFSKKAQDYLTEKMKEEVITYVCGPLAKTVEGYFGVGQEIGSLVNKLVEKIAKKICVNQKVLKTNKPQEVKDLEKGFKLIKKMTKTPTYSAERAATYTMDTLILEDAPEEQVLLDVSDTVTDSWLKDELLSILGADVNGEPDFSKAEDITVLDLSNGYIRDLNGLQYFTNLKELDVSNNELQDLSPLAGLTKLEKLNISGQFISNLYPISTLTHLTALDASCNELTTLASLTTLINLQDLDVRGNQLETLSSLSDLIDLRTLRAADNPLKDGNLALLKNLKDLAVLDLEDCGITSLEGINIQGLKELYLTNDYISDLSPISAAVSLKILDIANNGTLDIAQLAGNTALEELRLNENGLKNLNGLETLTSLVKLNLAQTFITEADLDVLSGLQSLAELDISDNPIFGIGCLTGLADLSIITVSNTVLSAADIEALRENNKIVKGTENTVAVQKLYFLDTEINLNKGEMYWQDPLCYPSNANLENLVWESSDPKIAEIDGFGIVTAKANGKTDIKVSTESGRVIASYTVNTEGADEPSIEPIQTPPPVPTAIPSTTPIVQPTDIPSETPTVTPTVQPTDIPSGTPTVTPTVQPTDAPEKIPSATEKTVTWTGGPLRIPVDLGGYSADDINVSLRFAEIKNMTYGAELDGDTVTFSALRDFDQYSGSLYQLFTKAGDHGAELRFNLPETGWSETITISIPFDSDLWNVSEETIKFDGSRDIVFDFKNGTNAYALKSISRLGLFIDKMVGNLFLQDGFSFDMKAGRLVINRDAIKNALIDHINKNGIRSLPDNIFINAFAITEGGEEVRFDMIEKDESEGRRDVAWSLDITEFKSAQASQQKSGQAIKNKYSKTIKKQVGSKLTQKVTGANTEVTFRSLNTKVAKVGKKSGVITCVGVGKAVIVSEAAESSKYKMASKQVTILVIPKTTEIKSIKSKKKGRVTIQSDTAARGNDGYQIQYKHNRKTDTVKIVSKKSLTKTFKNLRSGKAFRVRICAYKKVDGKIYYGNYSKWRTVKKVK